ncbi:phage portal protein [Metasolibacillus sp.]|uniref:phage portal protein n=1 Tax=Metasolibacillus sp. TaxID=2703680 RepID=UPI0025E2AFB6|nr:phage portal protein [Metasolibacillus sp.]MCT6925303.1 phage portal protein [Metasolibacillus sp.]MCT6941467.1 phage portal protein [Metasolibacillus sp.]
MLNGIKSFFRKVGEKLGLIKKIESVTQHKKIALGDDFYNKIIEWRALHRGHFEGIHDMPYFNIQEGVGKRTIATLNMPKVASEELATLIFNEKVELSLSDTNFNEFVHEVLKENKFTSNMQNYLEFMFAMGGMVIKPYVKDGKIQLSYVTADCFLPVSWTNARITEGVFISETRKQGKVYTHLEWHTFEDGVYTIINELYESENGNDLGSKVQLSVLYPDMDEIISIHDVEKPLFAYLKPNIANNIDSTVPLGISIYANSYDTLKSLDIAFDSLQREFRLGRKRIIVPAHMIKMVVDPDTGERHRYFDPTDETYEAFDSGNMDEHRIDEINVTLRVTEHIDAINALLNILAMQLGFSAGTFSFNGQSVKTATEVVSENSKTFRTKQSHENVIEQGIKDLIDCIAVIAGLYGLYKPPTKYETTIKFDDSIAQDADAEIDKQIKLVAAELQSRKRAIKTIFGVTDEVAEEIIQEIYKETLRNAPDLDELKKQASFFGREE